MAAFLSTETTTTSRYQWQRILSQRWFFLLSLVLLVLWNFQWSTSSSSSTHLRSLLSNHQSQKKTVTTGHSISLQSTSDNDNNDNFDRNYVPEWALRWSRNLTRTFLPFPHRHAVSLDGSSSLPPPYNTLLPSNDWCVLEHNQKLAHRLSSQIRSTIPKIQKEYNTTNFLEGLVFIKSPKASSTTGMGVTLRIAHRMGQQKYQQQVTQGHLSLRNKTTTTTTTTDGTSPDGPFPICTSNYSHPFAFFKVHKYRKDPCFVWTFVRHPAQRAVSMFFHFFVSRQGTVPNATNLIQAIQPTIGGQSRYITSAPLSEPSYWIEQAQAWERASRDDTTTPNGNNNNTALH